MRRSAGWHGTRRSSAGVALALALSALLVAGCDHARAASRARLDAAAVARLQAEAVEALAQAAQIVLDEPVPAAVLTAAEARERRRAYAAGLEQDAGLTSAVDLVADFVFAEGMLGRYLPDEKVLYVVVDVLERVADERGMRAEDLAFAVLAHELVHAYDDRVHDAIPRPEDLVEIAQDGSRLPEIQARMSFVEGRATWAAEMACRKAGREVFETHTVQDAQRAVVMRAGRDAGAAERLGKGMVNVLARAKLVQYAQGRTFAQRAWAFGGERFLAQVYEHMPLTLPELEDFERFKQRWAAEEEAALEAAEDEAAPASDAAPPPSSEPDDAAPATDAPR